MSRSESALSVLAEIASPCVRVSGVRTHKAKRRIARSGPPPPKSTERMRRGVTLYSARTFMQLDYQIGPPGVSCRYLYPFIDTIYIDWHFNFSR